MFSTKVKEKPGRLTFKANAAAVVLLLVVALSPGLMGFNISLAEETEENEGFPFCTWTAQTALLACNDEATDDYWIALGNCLNVSDPESSVTCFIDAEANFTDAKSICPGQLTTRLEICEELGEAPYDPQLDPANFEDPENIGTSVAANPYFSLVPGTVWVYEGETEEGTETITVKVTGDTKDIEYPPESGKIFKCAVVNDVVELEGEVIEDTDDWYAQDIEGNVWYFGEIVLNYEDGELDNLDGSWKAGKDSAKPGILMLSEPKEGDYYRQEFFLGDAEDMAEVVSKSEESVTVPFGTYNDEVLKTRDWTPIEPDVLEFKYYAPGIGLVLEVNPETGERVELISMTPPSP